MQLNFDFDLIFFFGINQNNKQFHYNKDNCFIFLHNKAMKKIN